MKPVFLPWQVSVIEKDTDLIADPDTYRPYRANKVDILKNLAANIKKGINSYDFDDEFRFFLMVAERTSSGTIRILTGNDPDLWRAYKRLSLELEKGNDRGKVRVLPNGKIEVHIAIRRK